MRANGIKRFSHAAGALLCLLAAGRAEPFYLPNEHPVTRLFGIPPAESGFIPEGWHARASFNWASISDDDMARGSSLMLDGETYVARLALRRGFADGWEIGLDLPYVRHAGGILDDFIESYHDTFGFAQGNRKTIPSDRLLYALIRNGETLFYLADPVDGPGDVSVSLGRQLYRRPDGTRAVAARAAVEGPTGDRDNLLGSGSTDIALSLTGTDTVLLQPLRLDAVLGVLFMAGGGLLEDWREPAAGFGSAALEWPATEKLSLKVQADAHSPLFDDLCIGRLDHWGCQVSMGGTLRLPRAAALDIAVTEDVAVATAPDVVFHFALSKSW
ncbi:MAG TPA: DUF3187 family protein [Kiritimatiellia bacterium]|nr:DUF3187 family protein [Kiritimatiellia bacterium]HRZ12659.1 DUF3187 family protein [Kiritimatiellia bacterium]HSA19573.1 DUF3187 family protein [Kiritimatiellia bacterium]